MSSRPKETIRSATSARTSRFAGKSGYTSRYLSISALAASANAAAVTVCVVGACGGMASSSSLAAFTRGAATAPYSCNEPYTNREVSRSSKAVSCRAISSRLALNSVCSAGSATSSISRLNKSRRTRSGSNSNGRSRRVGSRPEVTSLEVRPRLGRVDRCDVEQQVQAALDLGQPDVDRQGGRELIGG